MACAPFSHPVFGVRNICARPQCFDPGSGTDLPHNAPGRVHGTPQNVQDRESVEPCGQSFR
jgi:hypothetical protein